MAVTIGSNINALSAVRGLDRSTGELSSVYERLSSGQRINRASDDAAGLAVASSLNAKSRIYSQGIRNVNDGLSMLSIAEGALGSLRDIVTRVSELSEQAASGSYSPKQRVELDREADSLLKEYNRIIQSTSFNGTKILDGSQANIYLQHGIGTEQMTGIAVANEIGVAAGDGTFLARMSFATGANPRSIMLDDIDGNGSADILVADYSNWTVSALLSNGDGTFRARNSFAVGSTPNSMFVSDFNSDNISDVIVANYGTSTVSVLIGNGNGTFRARSSFATWVNPYALSVADLNGDGLLDVMTSDSSSNAATILLGNGDGSFKARMSFATGNTPRYITSGDVNGDGVPDLAVADQVSNAISVLLGNGDGTFNSRKAYSVGLEPLSIAFGDLNQDGVLDMVTVDENSHQSSVLMGNGDGTFKARLSFATGLDPIHVSLADLNSDGNLDIVTADPGSNATSVLLGNGGGTFQARVSLAAGTSPRALSIYDLNGDGVLDIATADYSSNTTSVFLGNADSTGRRNNLVEMVDLKTVQGARSALDWSKDQLGNIARELGNIGAYQSRLASVSAVLDTTRVNSQAASSRITDTDIAADSANLLKSQILQRTGQAVLAQANQSPQIALMLLRSN